MSIGRKYSKTYRRLQELQRNGKITTDECNAQVAEAQSILGRAQNGELSEREMKVAFNSIDGEKRKWSKRSGTGCGSCHICFGIDSA